VLGFDVRAISGLLLRKTALMSKLSNAVCQAGRGKR
jgi:hypothetical protein